MYTWWNKTVFQEEIERDHCHLKCINYEQRGLLHKELALVFRRDAFSMNKIETFKKES